MMDRILRNLTSI